MQQLGMGTLTMSIGARHLADIEESAALSQIKLRRLTKADVEELAQLYLDSYAPGVAVDSLTEAREEMNMTFQGAFGQVITGATLGAEIDGTLVGAIQTVSNPPWDDIPTGPFIIELFVHPEFRGKGVATALLSAAAAHCHNQGLKAISLRVSMKSAAPAVRLYEWLGFQVVEPEED